MGHARVVHGAGSLGCEGARQGQGMVLRHQAVLVRVMALQGVDRSVRATSRSLQYCRGGCR